MSNWQIVCCLSFLTATQRSKDVCVISFTQTNVKRFEIDFGGVVKYFILARFVIRRVIAYLDLLKIEQKERFFVPVIVWNISVE